MIADWSTRLYGSILVTLSRWRVRLPDEHVGSDSLDDLRWLCHNAAMAKKKPANAFESVEPIGDRVLVRKDEPKRETRGGIALPDAAEIPTITGRIVTISAAVENDDELPLRQYDKILFHPKNAIPVDLEHDNQLFVVPVDDVVAVFRRSSNANS